MADESDDESPVADDGDEDNGRDDDPLGEGEAPVPAKAKPSEKKANSTPFYKLCCGLERVWISKAKNKQWTSAKKLEAILPPKVLDFLDTPSKGSDAPESIYPIMRLLLPEKDGSRQFGLKESSIATMYAGALNLAKDTDKHRRLFQYTDPAIVKTKAEGQGDFSVVVRRVIESSKVDRPSGFTVGEINDELNALVGLKKFAVAAKSNHDWRNKGQGGSPKKKKKPPTLKEMRINWLQRVNEDRPAEKDRPARKGLSPLEHKWLVRLFLGQLNIGVGWKTILTWYHPFAVTLWSAHNSLKGVCDTLCDPNFNKARQLANDSADGKKLEGLDSYLPKSTATPQLGVIFSPMLTERTGFAKVLNDISHRHREYVESDDARKLGVLPDCLAFRHPAFAVEPKLDGERMLVHVNRAGLVKIQTRNGNWYSELYSPGLGTPIRKAVEGFDVILDGEVIAWDSAEQETIPFGNNRKIAGLRKMWLKRQGRLDSRDFGLHDEDKHSKSMDTKNTWNDRVDDSEAGIGKECWLQFVVFDILYVDGPEAASLLSEAVSAHIQPRPAPGSVVHLDGFERRKILTRVLKPQEHEVEIIETYIVRPDGRTAEGKAYFNPGTQEFGHAVSTLDSQNCCLSGAIAGLADIDVQRRHGKSDEMISSARAVGIHNLFKDMVERQRLEGLVFKDLATPYFLGEASRSLKYWLKFKPDYFSGSVASDLDLIVIGGYFAKGLSKSGEPSGLLCACVDHEDSDLFLPLCKVSAGSMDNKTRGDFLRATGFWSVEGDEDGSSKETRKEKWFRLDKDSKESPDFISKSSYQKDNSNNGWRIPKKDYPDLWIRPEDSLVVTLNAGEIVESDAFSAGITLRFPRITRLRHEADGKRPCDIESDMDLHDKYQDVLNNRSNSTGQKSVGHILGSPSPLSDETPTRFLTEEQCAAEASKKRVASTTSRRLVLEVAVPSETVVVSAALRGLRFTVLGQCSCLRPGSTDILEAREQGWLQKAEQVKSSKDVVTFIKNHGGTYNISAGGGNDGRSFVLGGSMDDPKVARHISAIENTRSLLQGKAAKTKKEIEQEAIAKSPGVLRWTFVYSLVHRWSTKQLGSDKAIVDTKPEMLRPTVLDYLARPKIPGATAVMDPDLFGVELSSVSMMRRAIGLVEQAKGTAPGVDRNWRDECVARLEVSQRWVTGGKNQSLWPYRKDSESQPRVVLYADIVDVDCAMSPLCSKIASALPLARVMGAFVVPRLSTEVTHILCDLRVGRDEIMYTDSVDELVFSDARRGRQLLDRLQDLEGSRFDKNATILVSPQWLRKRKW